MKVELVISCVLVVISVDGWSQSDSLRQHQTDSTIQNPVVPGLQSPRLRERMEFTENTSVPVLPNEIPPTLAKTLQQVEYRGWEKGKIFRHMATGEFKVEMIDDPYVRVFFFDKDGERIME